MMLTAIPTNPGPSLFAPHSHAPSSSPSSPETTPQAPLSSSSTHVLCGGMDGKVPDSDISSSHSTNQLPAHVIPMSAVHQPLLVGTGRGGYTLVPSIQQLGNLTNSDAQFVGVQPLGAISTLPRAGTTMQPVAAIPSGYYGRIQTEPSFQQQPIQQLAVSGLSPPALLSTGRPPSPAHPSPPLPPHHLLISGTGSGVVMNGAGTKPGVEHVEAGVIVSNKLSVLSPPSCSSSSPSPASSHLPQQKNSLSKSNSTSDSDILQRTSIEGGLSRTKSNQDGRRASHDTHLSYSRSRAVRHATRATTSSPPPPSSSTTTDTRFPDVTVKLEPMAADDSSLHRHHFSTATTKTTQTRRNSEGNLEDSAASSSSKSYQISALIDIPPMAPPLNRASRTSSLSSSLSSFRFGGSLSQLWASQISLSGKINNMKSTGNLNADTAAMPSLGNQYFAFGGSLPELSLTSLTRLLPNSSANDPGSCPGLFTLPLYVYPSQQHLATPFINTHGSISFGSFLSSGSSLCSTSKGPVGGSAGSNVSTEQAGDSSGAAGEEKPRGCDPVNSSATLLPESVIKLPLYSPPSSSLLGGASGKDNASIITSLPGFGTLTRVMEHNTMNASTSSHSIASITSNHAGSLMAASSPQSTNQTLPLPGEQAASTLQVHPQSTSTTEHPSQPIHPHHLPIPHNQSHTHATMTPDDSPTVHSDLYMRNSREAAMLPVGRIKLERDLDPPLDLSPAHGLPIMSPEGTSILSPHSGAAHAVVAGSGKAIKKEKEKPYKCDHPGCGRSFSFPAHLRSHIQQIHISYRPCKCEFPGCGKRFYTPQHLNVHRRVHTGERPFVCPYSECSKAFTTAGNLKNHIRTHTGERPYACKFEGCSKRFAEMSSLKKHELTHTGEKPYKCRVCGKAFSQAGSRNTHERKHNRTVAEPSAVADEGGVSMGGEAMGAKGSSKKYRIKRVSGSGSAEEPMQQ